MFRNSFFEFTPLLSDEDDEDFSPFDEDFQVIFPFIFI
jgi:hypothetical protein